MKRLEERDTESQRWALGDNTSKTILHSLQSLDIPVRETEEERVTIIKSARHQGICQSLCIFQVKLATNTADVTYLVETCPAYLRNMRSELEILIKGDTKIFCRFRGIRFHTHERQGKLGQIFLPLLLVYN